MRDILFGWMHRSIMEETLLDNIVFVIEVLVIFGLLVLLSHLIDKWETNYHNKRGK